MNKKSSSSTRGNTGANKGGPTHKNCNENTSLRPNSGERMARKSVSNEGSAILKFGSMIAASITELKDTMAVKFDQLEHILTRPDIWVLDTEESDDASEDNADNDSGRSTTGESLFG